MSERFRLSRCAPTLPDPAATKESYERDGFVVVKNLIDDGDLDDIRNHIKTTVDDYAREQFTAGKISSLFAGESFERRYAAICEELAIDPRGWMGTSYGQEFYDLYNLPGVLQVLRLLLGPEVSNFGSPALRTKLPGSVITSFPWHQDSQYIDQSTIGVKERHTEQLHAITVWVPLVDATVENGCCWVIPGSHRWGLLEGARGEDSNVRLEEDVEKRGDPIAVPLEPGGALFVSNLCLHTSKMNRSDGCRWSIDFRYFPTPGSSDLSGEQLVAAEFVQNNIRERGREPLVVLTDGRKPTWEEWDEANEKRRASIR